MSQHNECLMLLGLSQYTHYLIIFFPLIAFLEALCVLLTTTDFTACSSGMFQKFLQAILAYSFK